MFHVVSFNVLMSVRMVTIDFSIFSVDTILSLREHVYGQTKGLELHLCYAGIILL